MYDLRASGLVDPIGLDPDDITLTWRYSPQDDAARDGRVEIREADSRDSFTLPFAAGASRVRVPAARLRPRRTYAWSVSSPRRTSETRSFETGLAREDWTAEWIAAAAPRVSGDDGEPLGGPDDRLPRTWRTMYSAPPVQFRRAFVIGALPTSARFAVTARGVHRVWLNGVRVGDDELAPGWSDYHRRIEYRVHDVGGLLRVGENVLTAVVAEGWWAGYVGYDTRRQTGLYGTHPEFLAQLDLRGDDGDSRIATDRSWRTAAGHIRVADLLMGEYHDPAFATTGWQSPGFDDTSWQHARSTGDDRTMLAAVSAPPIRATRVVPGVRATPRGERTLVDFGQNLVGRVRITLRGQSAGTVVRIRHGEMLTPEGDLYTANLRSAEARDVVICAGTPEEVFEPVFTLHGFRYAEIRGASGPVAPTDVEAVVLASDLASTGEFETGSALVTRLQSNIVWGQRGNSVGIATDCPQRDERLGWTADTQVFLRTAAFNADVEAFLQRWLDELLAAQDDRGCVPDVVPQPPGARQFDEAAPGWGDAVVIVPWQLYEEYGDLDRLARNYPGMRAWVEYVHAVSGGGLWRTRLGNNYGDWLSVDEHTPHALVAAGYQIRSLDLVASAADALALHEDADLMRRRATALRERFSDAFLRPDGTLLGDTQTGYLFALAWGLVSGEAVPALQDRLVAKIEARGARPTSGFLGIALLCPVLTSLGRGDLAARVVLQTDYPSWGFSIEQGATTIWERWDGWTPQGGFQDERMNSFNHYSLGSVGEFLYRVVGGVAQAPGSVGYRRVRVAPLLDSRFSPVRCAFESPLGRIEVRWRLSEGRGSLEVEVPPGCVAEIVLPDGPPVEVSGRRRFEIRGGVVDHAESRMVSETSKTN